MNTALPTYQHETPGPRFEPVASEVGGKNSNHYTTEPTHKMVKSALLSKQERQKHCYYRQTKQLKPVHSDEKVKILQQNKREPAIVTEKLTSRSYEGETPSGGVYRHNRPHILKSGEGVTQSKDSVNNDTTASLSKKIQ